MVASGYSYKYNCHILIVFISSLERSNVVGIYNVGLYFSIGVYYDVIKQPGREVWGCCGISFSSSLALRDDIGNQCQRDAIEKQGGTTGRRGIESFCSSSYIMTDDD